MVRGRGPSDARQACSVAVPDALALHALVCPSAQRGERDAAGGRSAPSTRPNSVEARVRMSISACRVGRYGRRLCFWREGRNTSKRSIGTPLPQPRFAEAKDDETEAIIAALIAETDEFLGANQTAWRERSRALAELHAIRLPRARFNIYNDVIRALVDRSLYTAALRLFDAALVDVDGQVEATLVLRADRAALLARLGRPTTRTLTYEPHSDSCRKPGRRHPRGLPQKRDEVRRRWSHSVTIPLAAAALTKLIETSDPISNASRRPSCSFSVRAPTPVSPT